MDMKFKRLTQAEKNKLRRKALEALADENYGDDPDGFHEQATAQNVLALLDEVEALKAQVSQLKTGTALQRHHIDTLTERQAVLTETIPQAIGWTDEAELRDLEKTGCGYVFTYEPDKGYNPRRQIPVFLRAPAAAVKLPERIANINLRTPLEVEDMWIARFKGSMAEVGIKIEGNE